MQQNATAVGAERAYSFDGEKEKKGKGKKNSRMEREGGGVGEEERLTEMLSWNRADD